MYDKWNIRWKEMVHFFKRFPSSVILRLWYPFLYGNDIKNGHHSISESLAGGSEHQCL